MVVVYVSREIQWERANETIDKRIFFVTKEKMFESRITMIHRLRRCWERRHVRQLQPITAARVRPPLFWSGVPRSHYHEKRNSYSRKRGTIRKKMTCTRRSKMKPVETRKYHVSIRNTKVWHVSKKKKKKWKRKKGASIVLITCVSYLFAGMATRGLWTRRHEEGKRQLLFRTATTLRNVSLYG